MLDLLFATDFSESSKNAFEFGKAMIQKYPIRMHIMHVFDIPIPTTTTLASNVVVDMITIREEAVQNNLNQLLGELPRDNRGKAYAVYGTYPSTEIAEKAEKLNCMLIMMALRQRYSFFERLIGTNTANTIQKSSVPVLAVPNGLKFTNFDSILFPTEMRIGDKMKDEELKALEWLRGFLGMMDKSDIHVVHISTDKGQATTTIQGKPFPGMEFTVTGAHSIDEGILSFLEKNSMDLLAVYKPNRSFWERLYHSSVTRKLLEQNKAPLLVFS